MSLVGLQRNTRLASMADTEQVHRKDTMVNGGNEDTRWREKMLGGNNGLWTIECLRGRLLAERAASKAAKHDAELLGNKLIELERKLKLEIKLKNKAEKKLNYLMGKLQSLKLSPVQAYSSSLCNEDYSSSSTAASGTTGQQEQKSEDKEKTEDYSTSSTASSGLTEQHEQMSKDRRKTDSETNDIATLRPSDDNDSPSEELMKGGLNLRQTPMHKTVPKACQGATNRESSRTLNSNSFLFSAGA